MNYWLTSGNILYKTPYIGIIIYETVSFFKLLFKKKYMNNVLICVIWSGTWLIYVKLANINYNKKLTYQLLTSYFWTSTVIKRFCEMLFNLSFTGKTYLRFSGYFRHAYTWFTNNISSAAVNFIVLVVVHRYKTFLRGKF